MSTQVEDHPTHHARPVDIEVNGKQVTMPDREATGAQIKAHADVPDTETLFEIIGGEDRRIDDDQLVHLHEGMRFESGPDGTVS